MRRRQAERAGDQSEGRQALQALQAREQEVQGQLESQGREAQRLAAEQDAQAGGEVKELVALTDKLAKQCASHPEVSDKRFANTIHEGQGAGGPHPKLAKQ